MAVTLHSVFTNTCIILCCNVGSRSYSGRKITASLGNVTVRGEKIWKGQGRSTMAKSLSELTPWRQNPKVHHRIHNIPPPVTILSQLDPIYTPPVNLPMIQSDPILQSTPWSSKWSLSFWLSHQNPVQIPLLSHACYMSLSMYIITENIYYSQLSSVAVLLQPEPNCFTSYNTRKGLGSLSPCAIFLRSSPLSHVSTCNGQ
jgi:hypothetical protein